MPVIGGALIGAIALHTFLLKDYTATLIIVGVILALAFVEELFTRLIFNANKKSK